MRFLLEHLPPSLYLVIASRSDPPISLARLRARSQLVELRAADLRFTPGEAAEFLAPRMGHSLSAQDIATLEARTEGWIAGLQLAVLAMQGRQDLGQDLGPFIQAFSGTHRFILDYLAEEALNGLPADIQAFLLQTSILERMCAPLCEAVMESREWRMESSNHSPLSILYSQDLLEFLDRANLFLIPLDEQRTWFRYHHLFADLLRARLAQQGPQVAAGLHRRAARWYEQQGLAEEAVGHALKGQDYLLAAGLIEKISQDLWLKGEYQRLRGWIQALPEELVRRRPWLCIWNAWAISQTGFVEDVRKWIAAAEQAAQQGSQGADEPQPFDPAASTVLAHEIATLQAFAAGLAQEYDLAVDLARRVLDNPPPHRPASFQFARCNILHGLSSMYYAAGELDLAEQTCLETIRAAQEVGFNLRYIHAYNKLGYVYLAKGRLHHAYRVLQAALSHMQQQGLGHYFAVGVLYCRLIDVLYEWNQLDEAGRLVEAHLQPERLEEFPYLLADLNNIRARQCLSHEDPAGAQIALDQAAAMARRSLIWPGLTWRTEALQVRLWLKQGDVAQAAAWAAGQPVDRSEILSFAGERRELARVRILVAQGASQEAVSLLDRLERSAHTGGRQGSLVEIGALQAVALQAAGSPGEASQAAAALEQTLGRGEPEGYVRTFLDEGPPMAALLGRVAGEKRFPHRAYAARLLAVIGPRTETTTLAGPAPGSQEDRETAGGLNAPLVEPLSTRELEVLRCMAAGLSNKETAHKLVIETSTVKRHINNIFAKLGVENRVQALNEAKDLGLL
jgi:LuxR family maltose regulon positive regulatory protein